jgi:adenylate cyclase
MASSKGLPPQTPAEPARNELNEEHWRTFLEHPDTLMGAGRQVFSHIPSSPRCQLCAAPFAGAGGAVMRVIGKSRSSSSPLMCTSCERQLLKRRGGAEVESSLLFADVRGSTALGERLSPRDFRTTLARYYTVSSEAVYANRGIVDKFVGDELVAAFPPFLGADHTARALEAARDVLRATGHGDGGGPWLPVGTAVHTGRMWFGTVGEGTHVEITVLGDVVNTTARLVAAAGPGEILVSAEAATVVGLDDPLERRSLELKGKDHPTEVIVIGI